MVIPIIMPMPSGGGGRGYNGPKMDLRHIPMPSLPNGWHWEVSDRGGKTGHEVFELLAFLFDNPCTVWLYNSQREFVDSEHWIKRDAGAITRAAERIVERARQRKLTDANFEDFA